MDPSNLVLTLVTSVVAGGPGSVISLLVLGMIGLLWERKRLCAKTDALELKHDAFEDKYHQAAKETIASFTDLRIALEAIKGTLQDIKVKLERDRK